MKIKCLTLVLALSIMPLLASHKLYPQSKPPVIDQVALAPKPADTKPIQYLPKDNQKLRLQLAQKDAQLAQKDADIANANLQRAIEAFNTEMAAIEHENNWPENLQIVNGKTMEFKAPPEKKEEKKEEKK